MRRVLLIFVMFPFLFASAAGCKVNDNNAIDIESLRTQTYLNISAIEYGGTSRIDADYTRDYDNSRTLYLSVLATVLFLALIALFLLLTKNSRMSRDFKKQTVMLSTIISTIPDMVYSKDAAAPSQTATPVLKGLRAAAKPKY